MKVSLTVAQVYMILMSIVLFLNVIVAFLWMTDGIFAMGVLHAVFCVASAGCLWGTIKRAYRARNE